MPSICFISLSGISYYVTNVPLIDPTNDDPFRIISILPIILPSAVNTHLSFRPFLKLMITLTGLGTLESANKDEMTLIPCPIHPIEYPYFLGINISTLKRTGRMEKQ